MVDQLAGAAAPVQQIWLPPLPEALTLDATAGPVRAEARGLRLAGRPPGGPLRESGTAALVMTGDRAEGQLFPGVYAQDQPVGRGTLVRRGAPPWLIQTAQAPPTTARDHASAAHEQGDEHR